MTNLSTIQTDDFKLILGLLFLRDTKTEVLPFFDSLMMMESMPYVIPILVAKMSEKSISAMPFSKASSGMSPYFLHSLTGKDCARLPQKFEDAMPEEFPRRLPLRRAIDNEIELISGAKPLAIMPYFMAQYETQTIMSQLKLEQAGLLVENYFRVQLCTGVSCWIQHSCSRCTQSGVDLATIYSMAALQEVMSLQTQGIKYGHFWRRTL
ncbi:Uncharacterized protein Adt_45798 [Abeliophyllum distichum]|uniref:Uncharacterized protein n=1 Tax=Abeliophyllum distichum TaxID=126358 RepID=A0ABD1NN77_9LAMI